MVIFEVFWSKSRVLGQIGRSGKVLGFISSNFGPDPTAGCLLKGNNRGAIIIIIIIPDGSRPYTSRAMEIQSEYADRVPTDTGEVGRNMEAVECHVHVADVKENCGFSLGVQGARGGVR